MVGRRCSVAGIVKVEWELCRTGQAKLAKRQLRPSRLMARGNISVLTPGDGWTLFRDA